MNRVKRTLSGQSLKSLSGQQVKRHSFGPSSPKSSSSPMSRRSIVSIRSESSRSSSGGGKGDRRSKIRSSRMWDVKISKATTLSNRMGAMYIPSLSIRLRKRLRRISVEIHTPKPPRGGTSRSSNNSVVGSAGSGDDAYSTDDEKSKRDEHDHDDEDDEDDEDGSETDASKRNDIMMALLSGEAKMDGFTHSGTIEKLHDDERVVIRIFRPAKSHERKTQPSRDEFFTAFPDDSEDEDDDEPFQDDDDDDDDETLSTLGFQGADENHEPDTWIEHMKLTLDFVKIHRRHKNVCEVETNEGPQKKTRQLFFQTEKAAKHFHTLIERLRQLEMERYIRLANRSILVSSLSKKEPTTTTKQKKTPSIVNILIEIVSAMNLMDPIVGRPHHHRSSGLSFDPFCSIYLREKELHRTGALRNTHNPIWTLSSGSHYLLSLPENDFFMGTSGIRFQVSSYHSLKGETIIGYSSLKQKQLMMDNKGQSRRVVLDLESPNYQANSNCGKLVIRFRQATSDDILFMNCLAESIPTFSTLEPDNGVYSDTDYISPFLGRQMDEEKEDDDDDSTMLLLSSPRFDDYGEKMFYVKPYPDPKNPLPTEWMTQSEIESRSLEPSQRWIHVGEGTQMGKIFIEIIACDGFARRSTATVGEGSVAAASSSSSSPYSGLKTNSFISIAYENNIVSTDIIQDTLSPRWMPWSRRAFIFNVIHPSSRIFIGAHDSYDAAHDDHRPVGRISFSIHNFRPGPEYELRYKLYSPTDSFGKRESSGKITIRLRIQWDNMRRVIASALEPVPEFRYNLKKDEEHRMASFNINGKMDFIRETREDKIASQVEELIGYKNDIRMIQKTLMDILFWRPIMKRNNNCTICLPIHSVLAFVFGITLVEYPIFIPSFLVGSIAWIFLGTMGIRRSHPNKWNRSRSFLGLFFDYLWNRSDQKRSTTKILPHENADRVRQYETDLRAWQKEHDLEVFSDSMFHSSSMDTHHYHHQELYMNDLDETLATLCSLLRRTKNIITWEDSFSSFWITLASLFLSLTLAILAFVVPWTIVGRWFCRVVVWTVLGPWMRLIPIMCHCCCCFCCCRSSSSSRRRQRDKEYTSVEEEKEEEKIQIEKEKMEKQIDMKAYMFGKHVMTVPAWKMDRHVDYPLLSSEAKKPTNDIVGTVVRIHSQQLDDDIIPKRKHLDSNGLNLKTEEEEETSNPLVVRFNNNNNDEDYDCEITAMNTSFDRSNSSPIVYGSVISSRSDSSKSG